LQILSIKQRPGISVSWVQALAEGDMIYVDSSPFTTVLFTPFADQSLTI
jgi:hypothetical protein